MVSTDWIGVMVAPFEALMHVIVRSGVGGPVFLVLSGGSLVRRIKSSLKIKPDIPKKSDFSQADLPSDYEFRGSKYRVPPRPNTPINLKWGPVPTS